MIQELFTHPDFLIVNKPEGLSCHNDDNSLLHTFGKEWHLVNRIDRETSGLVVITKNGDLQNSIQTALAQGEKTYFSVLRGNLPPSLENVWSEWNFPISDQGEGRNDAQGRPQNQVEAKTLYRVTQSNSFFSAIECKLMTGRQHQIRKHSRLAGRPIVGDTRYGHPKENERIAKRYNFQRMALHAWKLSFNWRDQLIFCESPVPETFLRLFSTS